MTQLKKLLQGKVSTLIKANRMSMPEAPIRSHSVTQPPAICARKGWAHAPCSGHLMRGPGLPNLICPRSGSQKSRPVPLLFASLFNLQPKWQDYHVASHSSRSPHTWCGLHALETQNSSLLLSTTMYFPASSAHLEKKQTWESLP